MSEVVTTADQGTVPAKRQEHLALAPAKRPQAPLRVLFLLVLLVIAFVVWRVFFQVPALPASIVALSGRVEGDDSAVAPKTQGRILEITVREGDAVKAGQLIARLDDEQVRAREQGARAALIAAQAKSTSAQAQIAILNEQLKQFELQTSQARADADGRVRQADADLAAAEADLRQQEASYSLAVFDRDAYTKLAQTGAVSERQGKQAAATAEQQAASVAATKRRVEASRGALDTAQANLTTVGIRQSQATAVKQQILQQRAEIVNATAETQQARSLLDEAEANREDLTLRAPFDGTVITRSAEPGEVVHGRNGGRDAARSQQSVPAGVCAGGSDREGEDWGSRRMCFWIRVRTQAVEATVSRIDPQATFTPENTYFRDDRVKQVVGVKLQLKGALGFAKPGMPADGEILVEGDHWPAHNEEVMAAAAALPRQPAIQLLNLSKRYGAVEAVRGIEPGSARGGDLRADRAGWRRQNLHLPDSGGRDGSHCRRGAMCSANRRERRERRPVI